MTLAVPSAASAVEAVEKGSVISTPTVYSVSAGDVDGTLVITVPQEGIRFLELDHSGFMLTREEGETLFVMDAELATCAKQRADCQKQLLGVSPKPGFLSTPTGKAYVVAGFAVSVSAAFAVGVLVAR